MGWNPSNSTDEGKTLARAHRTVSRWRGGGRKEANALHEAKHANQNLVGEARLETGKPGALIHMTRSQHISGSSIYSPSSVIGIPTDPQMKIQTAHDIRIPWIHSVLGYEQGSSVPELIYRKLRMNDLREANDKTSKYSSPCPNSYVGFMYWQETLDEKAVNGAKSCHNVC